MTQHPAPANTTSLITGLDSTRHDRRAQYGRAHPSGLHRALIYYPQIPQASTPWSTHIPEPSAVEPHQTEASKMSVIQDQRSQLQLWALFCLIRNPRLWWISSIFKFFLIQTLQNCIYENSKRNPKTIPTFLKITIKTETTVTWKMCEALILGQMSQICFPYAYVRWIWGFQQVTLHA